MVSAKPEMATQIVRWHRRAVERAELVRMSNVELRDIRLAPGDAWPEARKPFWRE